MSAKPEQGRDQATKRVIQGLKEIYRTTILPLEQASPHPPTHPPIPPIPPSYSQQLIQTAPFSSTFL